MTEKECLKSIAELVNDYYENEAEDIPTDDIFDAIRRELKKAGFFSEKNIKRGDKVGETFTGIVGVIADIQYESDRYQFKHISGWRYCIENIVKLDN